eukprot:gene16488-biopygen23275
MPGRATAPSRPSYSVFEEVRHGLLLLPLLLLQVRREGPARAHRRRDRPRGSHRLLLLGQAAGGGGGGRGVRGEGGGGGRPLNWDEHASHLDTVICSARTDPNASQ